MTPSVSSIEQRLLDIPNAANRRRVQAYLLEEQAADAKTQTLLTRLDPIVAVGRHLAKRPWTKATKQDIIAAIAGHRFHKGAHKSTKVTLDRSLAPSTKYQWAVHLRTFYKWLLDTDETPEQFRRLPFEKKDATVQRAKELALKPDEVRRLLSGATSVRDRAIILVLVETGFRASEAAALRLDHMERRQHGYWFTLPSDEPLLKTGPREVAVPVIAAQRDLEAWLNQHPRRTESRAPLFVSLSNRSHGRRMTGTTLGDVMVRCARRAGMRHVHAHMLRHTSATLKIAKGMQPEAIRLTHGWTKRSTMLSYYAHVRPHYERLMLEVHGLRSDEPELLDILGSQSCQLCGTANHISDTTCNGCGILLSDAAQESERRHRTGILLDHVAYEAATALQDTLFLAVARAMGYQEATA